MLLTEEILDASNIATLVDDELSEDIVRQVIEHYNVDRASRKGWEEHYLRVLDMAGQKAEPKNTPWKNAANVKFPALPQAALQFNARVVPALMPNAEPVGAGKVGVDPSGEKTAIAQSVSRHMNYQLTSEMDEWEEEMDTMLMAIGLSGMEYKKTIYNSALRRNTSKHVSPMNLVINYYADNMATCRKTEIHRYNKNQIMERINAGQYLPVDWDEINNPRTGVGDEISTSRESDKGREEPSETDSSTPYTILEYHGYWDFDGDGYEEPYIIVVMEEEEVLLSILPRYSADTIQQDEETGGIVRITPFDIYTRYVLLPSPDNSFYGMGYGHLLYPINAAINTSINQLLDAGTMNTMQGGFVGRSVNMKGGMANMTPGRWININASGDDLRKGIIPLPTKEPSKVLYSLMVYMVEQAEKLSSTTDVFTGEHPGQNTKVGVTEAVREEGQKVFTAIYKRLRRALRHELIALYELNAMVLANDPDKETRISQSAEAFEVPEGAYQMDSMIIQPTADPNLAIKEQRLAKDQQVLAMIQETGIGNTTVAMRRYFNTLEIDDLDQVIPEDAQPPGDPEMEMEQQKLQLESSQKDFDAQLERDKFDHQKHIDILELKIEHLKIANQVDAQGQNLGKEIAKMDNDRLIAEENNAARIKATTAGNSTG